MSRHSRNAAFAEPAIRAIEQETTASRALLLDAAGRRIRTIRAGRSPAAVGGICQRLADLSQPTVYRAAEGEAAARGIARPSCAIPPSWPIPACRRFSCPRHWIGLQRRYQAFRDAQS